MYNNNNDNNNSNSLKFNIKCFEHEDNDIVSICDQCSSPVCLICMCGPSHRGHSFNLVEKTRTDSILNEFKKKTYPKSQKFKEQKRKEIQQTEQMYNTVKLNHTSNMTILNDKFKHLHQILSILENDIKRNLDTILSDNEELYIKTSTALEHEISVINDILNRHSFNSPSPTPMLSSSPLTTSTTPTLSSSPIDYNLNSVFNQSTKQYLSIIKDNHQLNNILNNSNQFDSFKSTHLEFNNEVIDNIKSSLKSIYNINTKLIIPTIINDNEDSNSTGSGSDGNEESGNEKIAGEDEDDEQEEEKEEKVKQQQIKSKNELSTSTSTSSSTTNLLQPNNKLYQFKIHYREVYNLPIRVEAYLISSHTLSLDENVNILIKVSPKDATVVPKGTKILIANKYFGSVTVEIPINLEMSLFDDDDVVDITNGIGGFYTTTTTTTTTTTNTKNTTSTTSSKYTPTPPTINTSYFKKIITFNELNRNFNSSFQPTLNIKIQFPLEIGVSYFSYMYPNISWFLGDLKPIKPITIGLEGFSSSGKTSTTIGLINLFNQSLTVQQNFTEELGGSSYFQTTKITYRSILKYINSTNSSGKLSSSDSGSSINFGTGGSSLSLGGGSGNSILIGTKSNSSGNSINNGYYVDSTFLKDFDISFLDSWGLIGEGDIPLKFKTLGKVHNHLSINERNTIGFGQASKREFSCDVFLFVVSIHNFKCNETMKKIEKRINEAIMLNITPVLAITFTDQVSTAEYASLVSSYTLPIGSNNIFKIINYNGLDIKKDLDKDLLFFKLLYRLVQLCNIKNFN